MKRILNFRIEQSTRQILEHNMRRRGHQTISRYLNDLILKDAAWNELVITKLNEILGKLR